MTRSHPVVFEKTSTGWSAFAPDVPRTAGLGDQIEDARQSVRAGIGYMLADLMERNEPLPEAATTGVDFAEFDPDPSTGHYMIGWLAIDPPSKTQPNEELLERAA